MCNGERGKEKKIQKRKLLQCVQVHSCTLFSMLLIFSLLLLLLFTLYASTCYVSSEALLFGTFFYSVSSFAVRPQDLLAIVTCFLFRGVFRRSAKRVDDDDDDDDCAIPFPLASPQYSLLFRIFHVRVCKQRGKMPKE